MYINDGKDLGSWGYGYSFSYFVFLHFTMEWTPCTNEIAKG